MIKLHLPLFFTLLFVQSISFLCAQCDTTEYKIFIALADTALENRAYERAINVLFEARAICPDEKEKINELIKTTFARIEREKFLKDSVEIEANNEKAYSKLLDSLRNEAVEARAVSEKTKEAYRILNIARKKVLEGNNGLGILLGLEALDIADTKEIKEELEQIYLSSVHINYKEAIDKDGLGILSLSTDGSHVLATSVDRKELFSISLRDMTSRIVSGREEYSAFYYTSHSNALFHPDVNLIFSDEQYYYHGRFQSDGVNLYAGMGGDSLLSAMRNPYIGGTIRAISIRNDSLFVARPGELNICLLDSQSMKSPDWGFSWLSDSALVWEWPENLEPGEEYVYSVCTPAGSSNVLVGTTGGYLYVFDLSGNIQHKSQIHQKGLLSLSPSIDGSRIISHNFKGGYKILTPDGLVIQDRTRQIPPLSCAAISKNGKWITGIDQAAHQELQSIVYLWNEAGQLIDVDSSLTKLNDFATELRFSPNGQFLLISTSNGDLIIKSLFAYPYQVLDTGIGGIRELKKEQEKIIAYSFQEEKGGLRSGPAVVLAPTEMGTFRKDMSIGGRVEKLIYTTDNKFFLSKSRDNPYIDLGFRFLNLGWHTWTYLYASEGQKILSLGKNWDVIPRYSEVVKLGDSLVLGFTFVRDRNSLPDDLLIEKINLRENTSSLGFFDYLQFPRCKDEEGVDDITGFVYNSSEFRLQPYMKLYEKENEVVILTQKSITERSTGLETSCGCYMFHLDDVASLISHEDVDSLAAQDPDMQTGADLLDNDSNPFEEEYRFHPSKLDKLVVSFDFLPSEDVFAFGTDAGELIITDKAMTDPIEITPFTCPVTGLTISSKHALIAATNCLGLIKLFDFQGNLKQTFQVPAKVRSLIFLPDETGIAAGTDEGNIYFFKLKPSFDEFLEMKPYGRLGASRKANYGIVE